MGTYFNPDNESFTKAVRSKIYMDKTGLLNELNDLLCTEGNCVALSHARRFGKSQAAGMIDAYYSLGSDSRELFAPFEIAKSPDFEEHLNQYNVIHLDISSIADFHKDDLVAEIKSRLYEDFQYAGYGKIDAARDINVVIYDIYRRSQIPFVIIVDEWDCVIRNHADRPDLVHEYLQFLHALFKSEESRRFLALAYITGILPIKKIKDESAMNNFLEYSMIDSKRFTKYFGFTEEEVKELCTQYDMDFESVKEWYNGYLINGMHMYNPNSVYQAMTEEKLDSYWKNTSAFDTINQFVTMNFKGLKDDIMNMLAGDKVFVNVNTFRNDFERISTKDEALTALIHLGYLAYDGDSQETYIPNFEVALAYQSALETGEWKEIAESISTCQELLTMTIRGNEQRVAELIEQAHETYTSILKYNDENSLSCVLTMAYFTAPAYYNIIRECPAGKGFADFIFLPRKNAGTRPAMVVELKCDESTDTAIRQIKEKGYTGVLKDYKEEVLLVGISYSKETKKHSCKIERMDFGRQEYVD
ncbi:MAG: ATP-binding protein [Eubacterium sp.]|nr:ATP-binding protein [Eubacterium sp.]